jgi:5'-3' exonuclease
VSAPLLAADVPWLLYRSFFALPSSIADSKGRPVNALLGTVNAFLNVIDSRPPRCVVACTGAEEAAYRVKLYAPYHAHRDPMPKELRRQWDLAPELLRGMGWTVSSSAELEADDVMFSHARMEEEEGGRALVFTGDRDLYGAVSGAVSVVEVRKGGEVAELGREQVHERYGVEPAQVADFIALRGDPSDGLPGARGIGAKTAAALVSAHGSLEDVLELARTISTDAVAAVRARRSAGRSVIGGPGASTMSPKTAAALCEQEPLLRTFKEIATLQRIEVKRPEDAPTDYEGGARAAREQGMARLAKRLEGLAATSA